MIEKWHRQIGLGVFLFLLLFALSGLALQHASRLGLGDAYVGSAVIVKLYGIAPDATTDYALGRRWLSHAGQFLYIDGSPVRQIRMSAIKGAVETPGALWVAGDDKLWLLSGRGEILDEFSFGNGLPDIVQNIGGDGDGGIVIRGLRGNWFTAGSAADGALPEWRPYAGRQPAWAMPNPAAGAPPALRQQALAHARGHSISWERLLADLHSGRLFGVVGIIVADLAALLLLLLAATGLFLWSRRQTTDRVYNRIPSANTQPANGGKTL